MNKEKLLSAIESADWPLSRDEIELIEYQIYLANVFIQQAKDLHDFLKEKDLIKEEKIYKTDYSFDSTSKFDKDTTDIKDSTRRSQSPDVKNLFQLIILILTLINLIFKTSENKLDSSRLIKRESVRNSELLRNLDDTKNKDTEQLRPGTKVIARNEQVGYYYSAKVIKVYQSRHIDVKFEDTNNIQYKMSFKNAIKFSSNSNGYYSVSLKIKQKKKL